MKKGRFARDVNNSLFAHQNGPLIHSRTFILRSSLETARFTPSSVRSAVHAMLPGGRGSFSVWSPCCWSLCPRCPVVGEEERHLRRSRPAIRRYPSAFPVVRKLPHIASLLLSLVPCSLVIVEQDHPCLRNTIATLPDLSLGGIPHFRSTVERSAKSVRFPRLS